jgi:hypothetical protein
MNDEEFLHEMRPWGVVVTACDMAAIVMANVMQGVSVGRAVGFSFYALLLVPLVWISAGRYARTCVLSWSSKGRLVRLLYVIFWMAFSAKLFAFALNEPAVPGSLAIAAAAAMAAGFSASRNSMRIVNGQLPPLADPSGDPVWVTHFMVWGAVVLFFFFPT